MIDFFPNMDNDDDDDDGEAEKSLYSYKNNFSAALLYKSLPFFEGS